MSIFWDEETATLGEKQVRHVTKPYVRKKPMPPFDPSTVKCGNCGGPDSEKGKKKIEDAAAKYELDAQKAAEDEDAAEREYWEKKIADAALRPETGRIVCIGCLSAEKNATSIIGEKDPSEGAIITEFWQLYRRMRKERRKMIGVNIYAFDLPFIITRSWILGIPVPETVLSAKGKWVNFDETFVDLRNIWLMNRSYAECESSLNHIAKTFGVGSKEPAGPDDCTGATFAQMWESGDAAKRAAARAYLVKDLELPRAIAARMGVV